MMTTRLMTRWPLILWVCSELQSFRARDRNRLQPMVIRARLEDQPGPREVTYLKWRVRENGETKVDTEGKEKEKICYRRGAMLKSVRCSREYSKKGIEV